MTSGGWLVKSLFENLEAQPFLVVCRKFLHALIVVCNVPVGSLSGFTIALVIHSLDSSGAFKAGAQCAPYKEWWAEDPYRPPYPVG